MTTKVQKWGNSLAVRIPSRVAKRLGFKAGSHVTTRESLRGLIIEPVGAHRAETLDDLLSQIDPNNLPEKIDWGPPVGNEIW